jgi:hypothetical protein
MIYLGLDTKIGERSKVWFVHYQPFDEIIGLQKTKEELEQTGIFVDTVPYPQEVNGKTPVLFANPQTKELWYEYEDLPKDENILTQELEETKAKLAMAELTIDTLRQQMITMQETMNYLLGV